MSLARRSCPRRGVSVAIPSPVLSVLPPANDNGPPRARLSRSEVPGAGVVGAGVAAVLHLPGSDVAAFRAWFAGALSRWLRGRFSTPEQVAAAFGVRNSTAWTWWHGDNRASGDVVARVFMAMPEARAWFLAEWGRR